MCRTLLPALLAALAPAWAAANDPKKPDFSPLTKGTKWEYRATTDGKSVDYIAEVTEVTTKNGKRFAKVKVQFGPINWTDEVSADENGVYLHAGLGGRYDPPSTGLKYPLRSGLSWTEKYKVGNDETDGKSTVKEATEVEVPAGKFKAVPVDTVITSGGQTATATTWYADGVGLVRMDLVHSPSNIKLRLELKKFTPVK